MTLDQTRDEEDQKNMSFLAHLEELRWHIIRSLLAIGVFSIAAFIAKRVVFHEIILAPSRIDFWTYEMLCLFGETTSMDLVCIKKLPFIIQSRKMTGQFTMHITSSLVIGLIAAFPYAFWEIWRFVKPALHTSEKQIIRGTTFFVSLLFFSGVLFGYYIISPISINFLANYQLDESILNEFDIISYVSTITMLVLVSGLVFQLPIIVYFTTKAGLITPQLMKHFWRHAVVVILVLSAIITPPDIISQILIAIPLMLLYRVSIYISKVVIKKEQN